ncbi:ubiquitin thioesterase OTUB2-like isoform X2 [Acipenser ruthenus]|nr:ubiquitin thioesterase OTUB2-like isoform X2 [Acipenser ruthenus]XP_058847505.1 ubiquitin thioesterase OTUB2-like isoform X2 [Acipenser ruthenus]XP_058847506.1 ubiquitin thioesterase OTUB2-like isoform X2 [Acipenser ruthenus]
MKVWVGRGWKAKCRKPEESAYMWRSIMKSVQCVCFRKDISKRYAFIRRIRGDGNCFYRAISYGHLESLLGNKREMEKFKEAVIQSKAELLSAGFDEDIFRNLLSTFVSVIEQTEDQASSLLSNFNDPTTSDIIVHYLRLLVSSYLQNRAEFFQHFVEAPNLRDFCVQDVETMGLECDHVQILALSQALGINIQIECMEGADCSLNHHIIPDGSTPSLHLLYKTAHYDILYKGSVCRQSQEGAYR